MANVLIVDSDVSTRQFCFDALYSEGHAVSTCPPGEKLFDLLRVEKPKLALIDPSQFTNESELLDLVAQLAGRMPVVIHTKGIAPELEKKVMAKGAINSIPKTDSKEDFCAEVNKALSGEKLKAASGGEPRILVTDDEPGIRSLLVGVLERKGYTVFAASSGQQAVKMVEKERPSLVLLDVTMPGMDGILTLKKIRDIDKEVPVILVTSVNEEETIMDAEKLGIYGYVQKPFKLDRLELVVSTALLMRE